MLGSARRATRVAAGRIAPRLLRWPLAFVLILLLGIALRFHGLGWDTPPGASSPLQMHPDERALSFVADRTDWPDSVGGYFDTARSPLNPYNTPDTHSYVYGTFPLFLVKGIATLAGDDPAGPGNSYDTTVQWGRAVTAALDVGTIALVIALGAYLFGVRTGLLGGLFYALAVLPTQLAHFWTMDPYVTFFGVATLLLAAMSVTAERWWARGGLTVLLGLAIGLGLASKVTAWPLALGPVLATGARIGLRDFPRLALRWRGQSREPGGYWTTDLALLCIAAVAAMLVFRVAQPYAFQGPGFLDMAINPQWRADIEGEIDRQNGNANFPPFVQFAGRTAVLWPLQNMVLFGLGPALGLAGWASLAGAAVLVFKRRELAFLLPLGLAVAVFAFQGPRFVAWMRYFAPMYPVLCLLAGWGLLALRRWSVGKTDGIRLWRNRGQVSGRHLARGATAALLLTLAGTAFWAGAFQNVYRSEHPRIQASRFIFEHIPAGAAITTEVWDDTLPYPVPGYTWGNYRIVELDLYETDSVAKVEKLVRGVPGTNRVGLDGADYVSISSNRVRDSVPRLERKYPATIRYYELLDSGELGFDLVATFQVWPSLFGWSIDDSGAEESFTVYDHPEVRIYRKSDRWDPDRAIALLGEAHPERAVDLLPRQGRTNGLRLSPEQARVQQSGGTFSEVFDPNGRTSSIPWLWWLLWLEMVAFAALPWVSWLLRALPDRGYGLSKLLGFAAVALSTWLLVAWDAARFSGELVWAVYAGVLAAGLALAVLRRQTLLAEARRQWPTWLAMEALFLLAFFGFLALRCWNPDLWHHPQGGEKPMELAYLTAVARSTEMPPYDPWFAGGTMNYYYMGWFFLATPMRALRIVPEVAFNLGLPTFAAMAASVTASTVYNLAALTRNRARAARGHGRTGAIAAGFLGAVLLVAIGNLDGAHQLIERLQGVNRWTAFEGTPVLGGATGLIGGAWESLVHGTELAPFDWWRSSRVHIGSIDITEFPFWSFLFADLHPHLMGLPFLGLVLALGVAYVATSVAGLESRAWALAAALGLALGLVRTVHTWDFPTATLIAAASIAAGQLLSQGRWDLRWWRAVGQLALMAAVLLVAFSPFTRHFEVFNSGLELSPETTKANQYLAHFGLFVVTALAFLAVRYHEELAARKGHPGRNPVLAMAAGPLELGALALFVAGLTVFTWRFGVTVIALSALLALFLGNLLWLEWRARERDLPRLLATGLFGLAFAIAAGVDVVTVKNDIERMNTVFKFSLQAWQLLAVAGAYGAWYVTGYLWEARGWRARPRPGRAAAAILAACAGVVLLLAASVFVIEGTPARQRARFADLPRGLDGLAYMDAGIFVEDRGTPNQADDVTIRLADDEPLIRWLRENVEGSPVIVEAVGPLYHWTGRISVNTGLPTVIGWDWHQVQQRWDYSGLVNERRVETQRFFTDADAASAERFLRKYAVEYVVVGTEERAFGSEAGLARFGQMPALEEVFRSGENVIYRVDQARLGTQ